LYSPFLIFGADYKLVLEESENLSNWNEIASYIIEKDSEIKFVRASFEKVLSDTTLTHSQSWSQETNYNRTAHVQIPKSGEGKHPIIIFLHGGGGTGNGMLYQYRNHFNDYIKVGMDGYDNKWNIKSESSKADDIDFLKSIIGQLSTYSNVDPEDITLIGTSNGAALVLKAIVEIPESLFKNAIYIASQLSYDQYREDRFWYNLFPSTQYTIQTSLPDRKKTISFHGTNDSVIPYIGGTVNWLNKNFYHAQTSAFFIAKEQGYTGSQLSENGINTEYTNIMKYSYLNDSVVHYKITGGDHGLGNYRNSIVEIIESHID
tara:strand:- start:651 stop:1604 length:954 start_codon:yes stop_codon:yes gene_type:complete